MKVDTWLRHLGLAVLAPRCLLCGEAGADGRDLCAPCHAALPWNTAACPHCALPLEGAAVASACGRCLRRPPPLSRTHAAFVYGYPLDRLVPRFKFHHDLAAGRLLAQLMQPSLHPGDVPQALVAVPLHPARLRQRGYDQAGELARALARGTRVPLLEGALLRVRATPPQSELDAVARRRNLRDAFAVAPRTALPAHVALVDDVMTTGATLHAAARCLQRAGVARVDAWVCARVP